MLMFKWILTTVVIGFVCCAGLSLVMPPPPNPTGPASQSIESRMEVPPGVLGTLKRSCYDCHSNETHWPAYSRVWPASAIIYSDVSAGRNTMNFSNWPSLDDPHGARQAAGFLMAGCAAMQSGLMPRRQYLIMHPNAKVSTEEAQQFCVWSNAQIVSIRKLQSER